jgi:hypothetical protein
MPWYLDEGYSQGAFATFLGVVFRQRVGWHAVAIGDSCLFHVREKQLRRAFPVRRSAEFDARPVLLGSRVISPGRRIKRLSLHGDWRQGDVIFLATDALGQWFLGEVEKGKSPWTDMAVLKNQEDFRQWIADLRRSARIAADDTTLLAIDSCPS